VDVIAYAPTAFFHCQHCEITFQQLGIGERLRHLDADESLPPDLRRAYLDLSDWLHAMRDRHGFRIELRVIDAASLLGIWMSLRHHLRRYPAVRVADGPWVTGDYRSLEAVIDQMAA
jgi:hypothetical protein